MWDPQCYEERLGRMKSSVDGLETQRDKGMELGPWISPSKTQVFAEHLVIVMARSSEYFFLGVTRVEIERGNALIGISFSD